MSTDAPADEAGQETAGRRSPAVSFYVAAFAVVAAVCFAWVSYRDGVSLTWALLVFAMLAAIADVREVRLPGVGHVGMSFVPVLAALAVLGLWPAMVVAAVSGASDITVTKDPVKIIFDIANCVLSTFVAGLLYVALVPPDAGFLEIVVPAFLATAVDFFASTIGVAGVIAISTGTNPFTVWRSNYQWGLPSYLTGATFALFAVLLYGLLGVAGLILAVPPVVLIYYSYDIYVKRVRDRETFDAERDSFQAELARSVSLHDELRTAQLKVAAEIERARRIQTDLLPAKTPAVDGLALTQRIQFLGEMGGDYYDYIPFGDGRLGIVCGDVMGKGLAAALIMAMARSLLHNAIGPGKNASAVLAEVNDGLARDLEGQRLPYFLTLVLAVYDPATRHLAIAGGGHNPVLVVSAHGVERVPSRGAALGVRTGLQFPEDDVTVDPGDTVVLYTDGITEARDPAGGLLGQDRLETMLSGGQRESLDDTLETVWSEVAAFRDSAAATDDATLLLARLV